MLARMANRSSPLHEASRQAIWINREAGRELRLARLTAGKTQRQVGDVLGHAKSEISRRENGHTPSLSVVELSRHAAVVGLRCSVKLYPAIRRPLDRPQLELLRRFRARVAPTSSFQFEVPMPQKGDLRAADALVRSAACSAVVEAITRFADVQAQTRSAQLKRRDLDTDRLILLVSGSRANREAVRAAGPMLQEAFPVDTRTTLRALAAGEDPGGDCLILL